MYHFKNNLTFPKILFNELEIINLNGFILNIINPSKFIILSLKFWNIF